MALKKTTYVLHCAKCRRTVPKDKREEIVDCPPEPNGRAFIEKAKSLTVSFPDYKNPRFYPQRAPNLPGEPVVKSYEDYQAKCKAAGLQETGVSNASRYRMRKRAMAKKRKHFLLNEKGKVEAVKRI